MPTGLAVAAAAFAWFAPKPPAHAGIAWVHAGAEGVGTGWVVDREKRWLVTCRHVVGERKKVEVFFPAVRNSTLRTDKSDYLGDRAALRAAGLLVAGTVTRTDDATDLALVTLDAIPPSVTGLSLARDVPSPGAPLRSLGNRGDLDTLWNETAGSLRHTGRLADGYFWRGRKLAANAPTLLVQLPIAEGDSGGPILDGQGQVVGVVSAVRHRTPSTSVGIAAGAVRKLLESAEPEPRPAAKPSSLADATVWIRPTATEIRCAGVLVDRDARLVLSSHVGVGPADRVAVLFPVRDANGRTVGELDGYADPVGLRLAGHWRIARVIARDPDRDLALLRLDSLPENATEAKLATVEPVAGDAIRAISHPVGVEFAWCHSRGSVRQIGNLSLGRDESTQVRTAVLQLPAQARAPGGPLANERGETVGVLAARDGPPQVGYAATLGEIRDFLAKSPIREAEHFAATVRIGMSPNRLAARAWAAEGDRRRDADKRMAAYDTALSLDSDCVPALLSRAAVRLAEKRTEDAADDLDRALAVAPRNRPAAWLRADVDLARGEPKQAVAGLMRLLDPDPCDPATRRRLGIAYAAEGDDAKSAAEFANAVRIAPLQLSLVAGDLLLVADRTMAKSPDAAGRAATALTRGLTAAASALPIGTQRTEMLKRLTAAAAIPDDAERLKQLRGVAGSVSPR